MNKYQEAWNKIVIALFDIGIIGFKKLPLDEEFKIINELINKEIELQSRKDKLVVGSEWECVVDCLCSVDDNKKQRKVGCVRKGSKFKIYEFIEVLGRVTIKEPLKFDIPIDQFLLCFKPR